MILTVSDVGIRHLKLVGPKNLIHALLTTRHFMHRHRMVVDALELGDDDDNQDSSADGCQYNDDNLRITAVLVYPVNNNVEDHSRARSTWDPQQENANEAYRGDALSAMFNMNHYTFALERLRALRAKGTPFKSTRPNIELKRSMDYTQDNGGEEQEDEDGDNNNNSKGSSVQVDELDEDEIAARAISWEAIQKMNTVRRTDLPPTQSNAVAISYIGQTRDYTGKFDKKAAMDLGVKPGALFRDLVNGKSVLAADGMTWVHPHQVIQGARPGRVFAVVDCPSVDYIPNLIQAQAFQKYYYKNNDDESSPPVVTVDCVVHLADQSVVNDPRYQDWLQRFGTNTQHIVVHADYCGQGIVWRGQAQGCYKLSKLSNQIFPLPYYENQPAYDLKDSKNSKMVAAEPLMMFMLEPWTGLDRSEIIPPVNLLNDGHASLTSSDMSYLRDYCQLADRAKETIARDQSRMALRRGSIPGKDVVMTSLGTGSCRPSKYRNGRFNAIDM